MQLLFMWQQPKDTLMSWSKHLWVQTVQEPLSLPLSLSLSVCLCPSVCLSASLSLSLSLFSPCPQPLFPLPTHTHSLTHIYSYPSLPLCAVTLKHLHDASWSELYILYSYLCVTENFITILALWWPKQESFSISSEVWEKPIWLVFFCTASNMG